jgi:hypothetical protein
MSTTLSAYQLVANNLSKWQQITASSPSVAQATKYYQANIGNVKTIADFVNNYRLFSYAMTAFGLGDRIYAKGLMREVLTQGVTSSKGLAHTLNDPRILAFAKTFNFAANGASTTSSSAVQKDVVTNYTEQALETNQGAQNPGVQLALYFQRNAPNISSTYGILADKNLLTVVQTTLGLSPLMSAQDINTQASLLGKLVNIADFKDPKKLQTFIQRFTAMYDLNNAGSTATTIPASLAGSNAILAAAANPVGISSDLLLSLQNFKLGGA